MPGTATSLWCIPDITQPVQEVFVCRAGLVPVPERAGCSRWPRAQSARSLNQRSCSGEWHGQSNNARGASPLNTAASAPESEEEAGSLLVTELLANVVLHAGTSATVALYEAAGSVVLSVTDGSPLLRRYSTRHGVQLNDPGKTIWAALSPHVTEPEDPAAALAEWADAFGS